VSESEPQQPAEINFRNGYAGMIEAFRARANERRIAITSQAVAQISGLPSYYVPKLLTPSKNPVRRIGMISLGPLLGVLGAKLVLLPDPEAEKLYGDRIPTRNESCAHPMLTVKAGRGKQQLVSVKLLRRIAPLGAAARNAKLSPARRKKIARIAARARWAQVAAAQIAAAKAAKAEARAAAKATARARKAAAA
jgi:hypothetical protein